MGYIEFIESIKQMPMIAFGIGQYFQDVCDSLFRTVKISFLCDNDPKKWGKSYYGLTCISPDEMYEKKEYAVVVTMGIAAKHVYTQLDEHDVTYIHASELTAGFDRKKKTPQVDIIRKLFLTDEKALDGSLAKDAVKTGFPVDLLLKTMSYVRFAPAMIEDIEITEVTTKDLIKRILVAHKENYLFAAKRRGTLVGYFQLADLIDEFDDPIIEHHLPQEKHYLNGFVFDSCKEFLVSNPIYWFVPVFDSDDNILCFAFLDSWNNTLTRHMLALFRQLQEHDYSEQLKNPPIGGIRLYDCNELAFELYRALRKNGFPCKVYGSLWDRLSCGLSEKTTDKESGSNTKWHDVYGELTPYRFDVEEDDYFVRNPINSQYCFNWLIWRCLKHEINSVRMRLDDAHVACLVFNVPIGEDLSVLFDEEKQAIRDGVSIYNYPFRDYSEKDMELISSIYGEDSVKCFKEGGYTEERIFRNINGIQTWRTKSGSKKIYLIGPCVVAQQCIPTNDTILGRLQMRLEDIDDDYCVIAIPIAFYRFSQISDVLDTIQLNSNDMVIFLYQFIGGEEYVYDLKPCFDARNCIWFGDDPIHLNAEGSRGVGDYIFEMVRDCVRAHDENNYVAITAKSLAKTIQIKIEEYLNRYSDCIRDGKNGAVVMNCNPFTKGHRYLIDQALKTSIDYLYIFVVEEDRSVFSFNDRIEMVRINTRNMKNVIVIPSGNMIISSDTLPEYFVKEIHQELIVDATMDLISFALGIAPFFHICKRFVGEEPNDRITNQYNGQMKKVLPAYGIDVIEIPRLKINDEIVSASEVRRAVQNGGVEQASSFLTKETLQYLSL